MIGSGYDLVPESLVSWGNKPLPFLRQCWHRSLSPYGVTRPQEVDTQSNITRAYDTAALADDTPTKWGDQIIAWLSINRLSLILHLDIRLLKHLFMICMKSYANRLGNQGAIVFFLRMITNDYFLHHYLVESLPPWANSSMPCDEHWR